MTRSEAYDRLVSKLVLQIQDICDKHNVPCVMTFEVGDVGCEETSFVTTMIVKQDASYQMHDVAEMIMDAIECSSSTDGDGVVN